MENATIDVGPGPLGRAQANKESMQQPETTAKIPLQVTYRGMSRSEALEEKIAERVEKLAKTGERILDAHVSVEASQPHNRGHIFAVHAVVRTPHGEVVVSNDKDPKGSHEDAYLAVRDAMDSLHRRIQEMRDKEIERRHGHS